MEGGRRGRGWVREASAGPLGRSWLEAQWLALAGQAWEGVPSCPQGCPRPYPRSFLEGSTLLEGTVGPH